MVQAGADWIKLATTGGMSPPVGEPLLRQLSSEEIAAIVDTAHAAGKRLAFYTHNNNTSGMNMTPDGEKLLEAAVSWRLGQ